MRFWNFIYFLQNNIHILFLSGFGDMTVYKNYALSIYKILILYIYIYMIQGRQMKYCFNENKEIHENYKF